MREQAEHFPPWSFDTNKGYPCATHLAALQAWGPSTIHRRSWVFMDNYVPWPSIQRIRRVTDDEPVPTLFDEVTDDADSAVGATDSGDRLGHAAHDDDAAFLGAPLEVQQLLRHVRDDEV
jgi:hypothetical protein